MKLEKAIELLELEYNYGNKVNDADFYDALGLGIGAIKRTQDMRRSPCTTADEILPGETDD